MSNLAEKKPQIPVNKMVMGMAVWTVSRGSVLLCHNMAFHDGTQQLTIGVCEAF